MLFKKEICITRDIQLYNKIILILSEQGIKYTTVFGSPAATARYRGVPFADHSVANEYRIFVSRKDYEKAKHCINR